MTPNHLIRLTQAAMLAALVAVFVPNLAQAQPRVRVAPDWFERYAAAHPYGQGVIDTSFAPVVDGRSPDTRDAADSVRLQVIDGRSPDTLEAAQTTQLQVTDGRSPDTLEAAQTAQTAQTAQLQVLDGRSPDTRDAAQTAQRVEPTSSNGFKWSDAGIGAASGAGLILLLGLSMLLLVRTRRHDVQAT